MFKLQFMLCQPKYMLYLNGKTSKIVFQRGHVSSVLNGFDAGTRFWLTRKVVANAWTSNNEQTMDASEFSTTIASAYTADAKLCVQFEAYTEMTSILRRTRDESMSQQIRTRQAIVVSQILIVERCFVASTTAYYLNCCICLTTDQNRMQCIRCKDCENRCVGVNANYRRPWSIAFILECDSSLQSDRWNGVIACWWPKMTLNTPLIYIKSKYRAFLWLVTVLEIQPTLDAMVPKLHAVLLNHPTIGRKFTNSGTNSSC